MILLRRLTWLGSLLALLPFVVLGCTPPPPHKAGLQHVTDTNKGTSKKKTPRTPQENESTAATATSKQQPLALVHEPNPLIHDNDEPGVIRGVVQWPRSKPLPPSRAKAEESIVSIDGKPTQVRAYTPVYVGEKDGVTDVMVWLETTPTKGPTAALDPAVIRLNQSKGRYRPLTQFAAVNSTLELTTADDDADFQGTGRPALFSRTLRRGARASVPLARPGLLVVRSDERPWMLPAYVRVMEHGYHAVTGRDGGFELPPVPPGDYEVMLWHAGWEEDPTTKDVRAAERRVTARVRENKGVTIRWLLPGT